MPANTISVTRPSRWGNRFKVDPYTPDRSECIRSFKEQKEMQLAEGKEWFIDYYLRPLWGKNLACWCKLEDECHADFWLELVERCKVELANKEEGR